MPTATFIELMVDNSLHALVLQHVKLRSRLVVWSGISTVNTKCARHCIESCCSLARVKCPYKFEKVCKKLSLYRRNVRTLLNPYFKLCVRERERERERQRGI